MNEIDRIVHQLTAPPRLLREAKARDGIPAEPGLYSWWTRRGSIPSVPQCPHPGEPDLDLFYVGISPKNERSSQNLRKRVAGNHMRGNTGGSTFRLTLASLLFETTGWQPVMSDRPLLTSEDNKALSEWQHENLRINWAVRPEPWTVEHEVIRQLQPPLNLAGNKNHPFAATVSAARKRFKEAAASNSRRDQSAGMDIHVPASRVEFTKVEPLDLTNDSDAPRHEAWTDSPNPDLPVEVQLVGRSVGSFTGTWSIDGALMREPGASARWAEGWVDEKWTGDPEQMWDYFIERGGGNGITWEVFFFRTGSVRDAEKLAAFYKEKFQKQNPFGFS